MSDGLPLLSPREVQITLAFREGWAAPKDAKCPYMGNTVAGRTWQKAHKLAQHGLKIKLPSFVFQRRRSRR